RKSTDVGKRPSFLSFDLKRFKALWVRQEDENIRRKYCQQFSNWSVRAAHQRQSVLARLRLTHAQCAVACALACTPPPLRSRTPRCVKSHVSAWPVVSKLPPTFQVKATTSKSTPSCLFVAVA